MKKLNPYLFGGLIIVVLISFVRGYYSLKLQGLNLYNILQLTGYVLADILIPLLIAGVIATIGAVKKNLDWNRTFVVFIGVWFVFALLDYLPK